jgi:hypothetical protein
MPGLAELVPQNGHGTANPAVRPWQIDQVVISSPLISRQVNKFRSLEDTTLWQARCTIPFVGHVQSLENPEKI